MFFLATVSRYTISKRMEQREQVAGSMESVSTEAKPLTDGALSGAEAAHTPRALNHIIHGCLFLYTPSRQFCAAHSTQRVYSPAGRSNTPGTYIRARRRICETNCGKQVIEFSLALVFLSTEKLYFERKDVVFRNIPCINQTYYFS